MAGCLDNIHFNRPEWLDLGEKRNSVASIAAGCLVCFENGNILNRLLWPKHFFKILCDLTLEMSLN